MPRRIIPPILASLGLAATSLVSPLLASSSASASGPLLQVASVGMFHGVLVDSTHHSLYLLTSEKGSHVRCSGACLVHWPPVLVKNSVTSVAVSSGVKGMVGFVHRTSTEKQVTFNGFPLYWFAGDSAPGQDHGVGIAAFGGTWRLVNASAMTSAQSPAVSMPSPLLSSGSVAGFPHALVTAAGRTLYLLSNEKGGHVHCSGSCLTYWPPLLVADSLSHVTVASGVRGVVGFVPRAGGMKQVTLNGFPVYTYAGDSASGMANGEGVKGLGGVWYVVNASATTASATPAIHAGPSATTTTVSSGY